MQIKCRTCSLILGSLKEHSLHLQQIHRKNLSKYKQDGFILRE